MTGALASLIVALTAASSGGLFGGPDRPAPAPPRAACEHTHHHAHHLLAPGGRIMPPGPGAGWGFPNGAPDGYGWVDYGTYLPLGANRTPDYFFPRHFATLPEQVFLPSYYNPYVQRGQRYIPYTACGGCHPNGGPARSTSETSTHPYEDQISAPPLGNAPNFSGEVEAPPIPSLGGGTDR